MNKKKNLVFLFFLILLVSCSFDTKTGIWSGEEVEKKKVVELKKEQDKEKNVRNIYSVSFLHDDLLINDIKTLLDPKTENGTVIATKGM